MLFNLNNEFEAQKFKDYCNEQYKKGGIVEVKRKHPQRSMAQNAYCHVVIAYWASEYGCTLEEAKVRFFKELVNPKIFWTELTNRRGVKVRRLRSTSELDKAEMTIAIERFRNWACQNEELPIYIPAPNEQEALVYAMQEIERNKEYL